MLLTSPLKLQNFLPTYLYLFMDAQNSQPFHSNVQKVKLLILNNFGVNKNIFCYNHYRVFLKTITYIYSNYNMSPKTIFLCLPQNDLLDNNYNIALKIFFYIDYRVVQNFIFFYINYWNLSFLIPIYFKYHALIMCTVYLT